MSTGGKLYMQNTVNCALYAEYSADYEQLRYKYNGIFAYCYAPKPKAAPAPRSAIGNLVLGKA